MSGDENRDRDPDIQDDNVHHDESRPNQGLEGLFAKQEQPAGRPAPDAGENPEDALFDQGVEVEPSEQFEASEQFDENSTARWPGHRMSASEIGIPAEQEEHPDPAMAEDDFALDSDQELELVDDERDLDGARAAAAAAGTGAEDESELFALDEEPEEVVLASDGPATARGGTARDETEGGTFLADEPLPEDSYPVEEGWEPIAATAGQDEDEAAPVEGEQAGLAAEEEPQFAGVAAGDAAEIYVDAAPGHVVGAPRRSRRVLRVFASLAAASIVVGAGAVVVLRPEWLGLHFRPQLVERVQIARPSIDVRVPTPAMPVAMATPPVRPVQPQPAQPDDKQPVQVGTVDPTPAPVPAPVQEQPAQPSVPPQVARVDDLPKGALLPVGESMWIGDFVDHKPPAGSWNNVPLGSKAFAQLRNGNFFIGSIKGVAADALVMKVETGEITLGRDEIEKVTALDSEEYAALQKATAGYIRLNNRNRLVGSILKSVIDDNYVLQMRSDRIVVPKSVVNSIVEQGDSGHLRFSSAADEEQWLLDLAARQLKAMATGAATTTSPVPGMSPPRKQTAPQPAPKTTPKAPAEPRQSPAPARTRPKPK